MNGVTQMVSRFKRKSPVDILFHTGLILLVIGILSLPLFYHVECTWVGIIIVFLGIVMIIYGVIKYEFFCKRDPYSLMPPETQVQNRLLNLLGDNTNPHTVSAVTNAVKTMSIDSRQKGIGGASGA